MPVLFAAVALLGLAIGSFLNVVIYRVPAELSLSSPPSRCPACEHPIRKRHNIPVLGWLILRGRCADCATPISARYPLVELLTAALFVAVSWQLVRLHLLPALPAYLLFTAIAIALAVIDIDLHRLPSAIVLPAYPVLALALILAAVVADDPASLVRAAVGGMALFLFYFLMNFAYPKGMGYGDVRLSGVVGSMLGYLSYSALLVGAFASFLIGGVFGILVIAAGRGSRKSHVPFGPFMLLGVLVAILASSQIASAYRSLALGS